MRLRANIGGKVSEVDIEIEERKITANIDGRLYELRIGNLEAGSALLFDGNRLYDCRILRDGLRGERVEVHLENLILNLELSDPRVISAAQTSGGLAEGVVRIVAPMPGKVVRVLTEEGAQVEADQGILVVEAMKMQNELRTPRGGIVSSLNVSEGATVNAGDVLAIIE